MDAPPATTSRRAELLQTAAGRRLSNWGDWFAYTVAAGFLGVFEFKSADDSAVWLMMALFLVMLVQLFRLDRRIKALLELLQANEPANVSGPPAAV
ncbi:MAG TPA: hypothetical protein VNL18_04675 [Gemmatimonadales bacterium]|nr:hypothetical protein [Gemmatimonadales bacterium]